MNLEAGPSAKRGEYQQTGTALRRANERVGGEAPRDARASGHASGRVVHVVSCARAPERSRHDERLINRVARLRKRVVAAEPRRWTSSGLGYRRGVDIGFHDRVEEASELSVSFGLRCLTQRVPSLVSENRNRNFIMALR